MGTVYAKESRPAEEMSNSEEKEKKLNLSGISARIEKVHIDGLRRTKDDIVTESVKELFDSTDFFQVLRNTHRVRDRLEALGCFKRVDVFIDTSSGQDASPDGLEVTFTVKELGRIKGQISAVGGDNEGSLVVGVQAPNFLGRGEKAQFETSFRLSSCNNFHFSLAKPLRTATSALLSASVYQQKGDFPTSGYKITDRGLLVDLAFNSRPNFKHNLQYEASWRELGQASKTNSLAVRKEYGHTLKSAVRHILTIDKRDSPIFPTHGALLRLSSELAGLGGDVSFHKHEATSEFAIPLLAGLVLVGRAQAGILQPIPRNLPDGGVNLADRFYLGGPTSVRGFNMRGIGPRPDGLSVGANMYWATGLHMYSPLPFRPGRTSIGEMFRLHAFTTIGQCENHNLEEGFEGLLRGYRASWGAGLALRIGQIAQLELNYVMPFMFRASDALSPGIQFGLGVQFL